MTGPVTWLRVLCWNVHGLRDDAAALVRTVAETAPHLAVLQEAPRVVRWRTRAATLAHRCGLVVVAGGGGAASGNLLLGSLALAVHHTDVHPLSRTRGQHHRAAVIARCSLNRAVFTAVGVHLGLTAAERRRHVGELLAAPLGDGPTLLAGDLNETPDDPAWQTLTTRFTDPADDSARATPTFSTTAPRRRIDTILTDPDLPVRRYTVLDSPAVRRASDHRPVLAEIGLPSAP